MIRLHGFELQRETYIPELDSRVKLWRHLQTGAELLSVENDDENKSFAIGFKTPPADDTGLPHILEHSVLAGSRKYPVKEPFVELLKTSLKTFLNAMTFADTTIYPVASTNLRDFYNLVDVYLDAVFFPRIDRHTFEQEGWHYELESVEAPLIFKGVVFNEMKSVYSMPEAVMDAVMNRALLPNTPYAHDSGGFPPSIPNLTYEQFCAFHATYYHPSNARIFFYGDDDPEERLRLLDAVLSQFQAHPIDATLPLQPRFSAPRKLTERVDAGEADEDDKRSLTVMSWLLPESNDPMRLMQFELLAHILIETPASPLRRALIESGLGEDLTGSGLNSYQREMSFSVGLKGIVAEDADEVEALILQTLTRLAEEGIDPAMIEAALNTFEFQLRERNTGGYPRGLATFIGLMPVWMHGGDVFSALAFEGPLSAIKAELAQNPRFFEGLIRSYLLDNPHRVTVTLVPDPQVGPEREAAEKARLEQARAQLSAADLEAIVENTRVLRERQNAPDSPEALATIPTLSIRDIDPKIKIIPSELLDLDGVPTLYHDLHTRGVAYLDLAFDLSGVPQHLVPYLDLFSKALLEIGTEQEDYVRLSQRIGAKTGGLYASSFASALYRREGLVARLLLRGKAMPHQVGDMLAIMADVLLTLKLDNRERFRQMVLEEKAGMETYLPIMGQAFVGARLRAHFDPSGWFAEQTGGISQLFFLRELAARIESDWEGVLADLEAVRAAIINRRGLMLNVTLDASNWAAVEPQVRAFLGRLPSAEVNPQTWDWRAAALPAHEGLSVPAQVNFVGKGANLYALGYEFSGAQIVILKHMNLDYLWNRVRVQGGAYGGALSFSQMSGVATFLSWRDPNLVGTLAAYDGTADYLRGLQLSADDLEKAIIGAIGQVDSYQLPDAKGFSAFVNHLVGYTDADRQRTRDQILGATLADFHALADVLERVAERGAVVALGSPQALAQANQQLAVPLQVTPVL